MTAPRTASQGYGELSPFELAAGTLTAAGFTRVMNLSGGTLAHVAAGLPVER